MSCINIGLRVALKASGMMVCVVPVHYVPGALSSICNFASYVDCYSSYSEPQEHTHSFTMCYLEETPLRMRSNTDNDVSP